MVYDYKNYAAGVGNIENNYQSLFAVPVASGIMLRDATAMIYDISGCLMADQEVTGVVNLSKGIYIVKKGNRTAKLAVTR